MPGISSSNVDRGPLPLLTSRVSSGAIAVAAIRMLFFVVELLERG